MREVIFAVRAIGPLCAALLLLVLAVLRIPLPVSHFDTHADVNEQERSEGSSDDCSDNQQQQLSELVQQPSEQVRSGSQLLNASSESGSEPIQAEAAPSADALSTILLPDRQHSRSKQGAGAQQTAESVHSTPGACMAAGLHKSNELQEKSDAAEHVIDTSSQQASMQRGQQLPALASGSSSKLKPGCWAWVREHSALLWGMVMCQVGMVLFNLGLTYGFTALGDMTGTWLPSSFMKLPYAPGSPYYSVAGTLQCLLDGKFGFTHRLGKKHLQRADLQRGISPHCLLRTLERACCMHLQPADLH